MHFEVDMYAEFLEKLRQLRFVKVERLVIKRADLQSFPSKGDGSLVTYGQPWFGDAWAEYTQEEQNHIQATYDYWLLKNVSGIYPDFWEEFKLRVIAAGLRSDYINLVSG